MLLFVLLREHDSPVLARQSAVGESYLGSLVLSSMPKQHLKASKVVPQLLDLSEMYLAKFFEAGVLVSANETCDWSCGPGFDHNALVAMTNKQHHELLVVKECIGLIETNDVWTVAQPHSPEGPIFHGHARKLPVIQLRVLVVFMSQREHIVMKEVNSCSGPRSMMGRSDACIRASRVSVYDDFWI